MLNRTVQNNSNNIYNVDGGRAEQEDRFRSFVLQGLNLQLTVPHKGYFTNEDELGYFEEVFDALYEKGDIEYIIKATHYLSDKGRRMSPVIALTRFLIKNMEDSKLLRMIIREMIPSVFDNHRPDKIANSLGYFKKSTGCGSISNVPPFYRRELKEIFESFSPLTLKKRRMTRREIKLRDLIQVLHPKPCNETMSKLYKDIIENNSNASLEQEEHVTEVLSDKTKTRKEKQDYVQKNVKNMPINALIRNISMLSEDTPQDYIDELAERLENILEDTTSYKFFNLFDLLIPTLTNQKIISVIDNALGTFFARKKDWFKNKEATILLDVSGSMFWDTRWLYASKYLTLVTALLDNATKYPLHLFNRDMHQDMKLSAAIKETEGKPLTRFIRIYELFSYMQLKYSMGTSLADSIEKVVHTLEPETKNLVVISDEIRNSDTTTISMTKRTRDKLDTLTFFNANFVSGKVLIKEGVMRISGLYSSLIDMLNMYMNADHLKEHIINRYSISTALKEKLSQEDNMDKKEKLSQEDNMDKKKNNIRQSIETNMFGVMFKHAMKGRELSNTRKRFAEARKNVAEDNKYIIPFDKDKILDFIVSIAQSHQNSGNTNFILMEEGLAQEILPEDWYIDSYDPGIQYLDKGIKHHGVIVDKYYIENEILLGTINDDLEIEKDTVAKIIIKNKAKEE